MKKNSCIVTLDELIDSGNSYKTTFSMSLLKRKGVPIIGVLQLQPDHRYNFNHEYNVKKKQFKISWELKADV